MSEPKVEILREDINAHTKQWVRAMDAQMQIDRAAREDAARQRELLGKPRDELFFLVRKLGDRYYHAECISGSPIPVRRVEDVNGNVVEADKVQAYGVSPEAAVQEARFFLAYGLMNTKLEPDRESAFARGAEAKLRIADVVEAG